MSGRGVVALVLACLAGGVARAEPGDYAVQARWNGLGSFALEARNAGCTVEKRDVIDWSALTADDVLAVVYPRAPLPPDRLLRWLGAGGTALLADDFGAGAPAFAALALDRRPFPGGDDVERWDDRPALPVAKPVLQTALGRSAALLVANRPAVFLTSLPPTFAFGPEAALVVEGRVGKGRFVALADPSVLIDLMLEIDENLAFARALAGELCAPGAGKRLVIVSQAFRSIGEPPSVLAAAPDPRTPAGRALRLLGDVDGALDRAVADPRGRLVLLLLAALVAGWYAGSNLPAARRLAATFFRAPPPPTPGAALVESGPGGDDYGQLAAALRAEALERLSRYLGRPLELDRAGPRAIAARVTDKAGPRAGKEAAWLWRLLLAIRWRVVDGAVMADERVPATQFLALHRSAATLFSLIHDETSA